MSPAVKIEQFGRELLERRVPHALLFYFGVCWGVLEFTGFLQDRYGISKVVTDVELAIAVTMLPATLILTWTHGKPGPDPWGRLEKGALGGSAMGALLLSIVLVARAEPATAPTSAPTATATAAVGASPASGPSPEPALPASAGAEAGDRAGTARAAELAAALAQEGAQPVAPALDAHHRQPCVLVFPLAGELDPADRALRTILGPVDDLLAEVERPWWNLAWYSERERLRDTGVAQGRAIPQGLMRQLADTQVCTRVLHGTIRRTPEGLVVGLRIAEGPEVLASTELSPSSLLDTVDAVAAWAAEQIGEGGERRLVREAFTSHEEAFALYLRARDPLNESLDRNARLALFDRALEVDPTFAMNALSLAGETVLGRPTQQLLALLEGALAHGYRLPEVQQLQLSALYFLVQGQFDRAERATLRALEARPGDLGVLEALVQVRLNRSDVDGALAALEAILDLAPDNIEALDLAQRYYDRRGRVDEAVAIARRRVELRPEDPRQRLRLGAQLLAQGEYDEARAAYEEAAVMAPTSNEADIELASLELMAGDHRRGLALSRALLDRAAAWLEREPRSIEARREHERAAIAHAHGLFTFGRARECVEVLGPVVEALVAPSSGRSPPQVISALLGLLHYYRVAGRVEEGRRLLDQVPQSDAPYVAYMRLYAELVLLDPQQQRAAAAEVTDRIDALLEQAPLIRRLAGPRVEVKRHLLAHNWTRAVEVWEAKAGADLTGELDLYALDALVALERWDDVRAIAERELRGFPNWPKLLLVLVRVEHGTGHVDRARAQLERIAVLLAEADPDFPPWLEAQELHASLSVDAVGG
ncbi:MAG: tetratricopeptide repeat protein [Myxococcota bacterium]